MAEKSETLSVDGQCPVQGYAIREGHLFYFRARGEWTVRAWAPGDWTQADGETPEQALERVWIRTPGSVPSIALDEGDEDSTFPVWPHDGPHKPEGSMWTFDEGYPGWWTHDYAASVFEWAVSKVLEAGQ